MLSKRRAFYFAAVIYLVIVLILLAVSLMKNNGKVIYALDDPYIHMAVARNFALSGTWGINCGQFASCSSSPLYTLILGISFYIFGVAESIPLIINVLAGAGALMAAFVILNRHFVKQKLIFLMLLILLFVSPLFAITFVGMEHTAHLAAALLFVYFASRTISSENRDRKAITPLLITAPLIMSLRYESVFLLLPACALLFLRRRFRDGLAVGAAGLAPILIYGLVSYFKGGNFIPNPILLKGNTPYFTLWGAVWWGIQVYNNISSPHVILLLLAGLSAFLYLSRTESSFWNQKKTALVIFLVATLFHMVFASTEWFFRYDAYLVAIGLTFIFAGFSGLLREGALLSRLFSGEGRKLDITLSIVILLITLSPLLYRAASLFMIPQATSNIYQQQYQMGLFVERYYSGEAVAANDTGAISFLSHAETVDLWGLGSNPVLRAKKGGYYDTEWIDDYTDSANVKVAVLYESWFENYGGLPAGWEKVCQWTIPHEIVCGEPTVSFFAVNEDKEELRKKMAAFSSELPGQVRVRIYR